MEERWREERWREDWRREELSMTIPAESLQGRCEVVWPTKV